MRRFVPARPEFGQAALGRVSKDELERDANSSIRRTAARPCCSGLPVIIAIALIGLAGCGFRPLYGEDSAVGSANLSGVRIATIQDVPDPTGRSPSSARAAQQLRNFLLDRVTPRGQPAKPQYELRVNLREAKLTALGIRTDETATRATLIMTAGYALVRLDGGGTILSASTRSDVSYNILRNEFSTLSAENDARRRAAREISDTIALEVANAVGAYRQGALK